MPKIPPQAFKCFQQLSQCQRNIVFICIACGVAFLDVITPSSIFLTGFYLIPIGLALWFSGTTTSVLVTVISLSVSEYMVYCGIPDNTPLWLDTIAFLSPIIIFAGFVAAIVHLKTVVRQLMGESRTDALTGIRNRRGFFEIAEFELLRVKRSNRSATVAILDIDNFKLLNDTQGHGTGDALLVSISRILVSTLREIDIAGRLGGDEFVIFLPETDEETARIVLQRLHENLVALLNSFDKRLGTSIGAVIIPTNSETSLPLAIEQADRTMYSVKNGTKGKLAFAIFGAGPE